MPVRGWVKPATDVSRRLVRAGVPHMQPWTGQNIFVAEYQSEEIHKRRVVALSARVVTQKLNIKVKKFISEGNGVSDYHSLKV